MFRPSHNPFVSVKSDLAAARRECSGALVGIVVFSGLMNLLTLTGPIFMLQVYDRVVPSKSIATLLGLGLITPVLYGALGFFDQLRARPDPRRRLCRRDDPSQGVQGGGDDAA